METQVSDLLCTILLSIDSSSTGLFIASGAMVLLLILSALFSGSEVAFFSLGPSQLHELNDSDDKSSERILDLLQSPSKTEASKKLLATILVANNFVNIAIVLLSTYLVDYFVNDSWNDKLTFTVQIVLVTFIIVLFGEVIPKVYATNNNVALARLMSFPLQVSKKLFYPMSTLLIRSTGFIDRRFENQKAANISKDELEQALELTKDEERSKEEHKILEGIVSFGSIDVKQIMINRVDITAINNDTSFPDLMNMIENGAYSRIPVFDSSIDEIVGVLYVKDLLLHIRKKDFEWQPLVRNPYFIPENKMIDDLLKEFQEKKIHMALVVDEYGGTSGLITLEDIIEEIVGEITDEFDNDDINYSKLDDDNFIFEGKTPLIDVYRLMNIDGDYIEKAKGESDSLAGFVIEQSGKIPLKGETIVFENLRFTIEASDRRKVKRIKVTKTTMEHDED